MPVNLPGPRLSGKLFWIAIVFLAVALAAVGFTLYESWKLEGGAAVINDMGSERMRSYRIAYLLAESVRTGDPSVREQMRTEMRRFEDVLTGLKVGDPVRPLVLPRDREIVAELDAVEERWFSTIKPLIERAATAAAAGNPEGLNMLRAEINAFVERIDQVVRLTEANNARNIAILRYMQFGLIALALAGAVTLIYLMFLLVVRPVNSLADGIRRMTAGEFSARVPVETDDEFGDLAEGFNRMASRLQESYATLEERVAEKTIDLAARNRELAALYEVSRLLNEPASTEEFCRGFLRRLMALHDAAGGAVRLVDASTSQLHLYAHEGLTSEFASEERCIDMGECLCGSAAQVNRSAVDVLDDIAPDVAADCRKAGYRTVAIFPIRLKRELLGIFNLYFKTPRAISPEDRELLDALGQHLAIAIENQRLASRDRELAVFEERSLLARELHDSIAQSLAFLNIQVQLLEDSLRRDARGEITEVLSNIREGVQESYDNVRELLTHFRVRVKQEEDVGVALRRMLERFGAQSGLAVEFSDSGTGVPLHAESQLQVLHILQEALSNVRKHAGATRVRLAVQRDADYRFTVADDGSGFDVGEAADAADSHIGLRIMRERAQRIGATVEVQSKPRSGAIVTLTLPVGQGTTGSGATVNEVHA
ncbi:MAG: type IV pili methyl-accepting chemotaxis transducer N-terminal domain-containing protein [Betaproteobacteria bacterium]|nr:type IV pili methyl-accepting chemotaxis transducer N-terminal domain-containing protein [Betaproteobacteria bacterium]MDH5344053.1 type IV pili methyl-accepting chemotaxis transducer N-terminal domain-containing protein [Betaproteobacteria bacterium]